MPGRVVDDVEINMPGRVVEEESQGLMAPPKKRPAWETDVYSLVSDKLGVDKTMQHLVRHLDQT